VREPYGEGLASHTGSESCAWNSRKAAREALTGAQAGRVLSREMDVNQSADAVRTRGRQHQWMRECEHSLDSARSETPAYLEKAPPRKAPRAEGGASTTLAPASGRPWQVVEKCSGGLLQLPRCAWEPHQSQVFSAGGEQALVVCAPALGTETPDRLDAA
jgi:hypothetical protein